MSFFGFRWRRPAGRHVQPTGSAAGATILPGVLVPPPAEPPHPAAVALVPTTVAALVDTPAPAPAVEVAPRAEEPPVPEVRASVPFEVPVAPYAPPLEVVAPSVDAGDAPENSPRVGLFFGDGTHVFMEASDPRAVAFTELADELNR